MIWENGIETCIISYKKQKKTTKKNTFLFKAVITSTDFPEKLIQISLLYLASNLDWRFVSHMIIYMFQCHSPKSSHPHSLPQSSKDCSIHLCLLPSHIQGYRYHLSKFHIYALVYCVGVFLSSLLHSG